MASDDKLDADEDHDQIAGRGDEQRAENGEGEQYVELADRQMPLELIDVLSRGTDTERSPRRGSPARGRRSARRPGTTLEGRLVLAVLGPERRRGQPYPISETAVSTGEVAASRQERIQRHAAASPVRTR